jgi:hypothetical protein
MRAAGRQGGNPEHGVGGNWSGLFVFAVIAGLSRLAGIAMVRASGDLAL